MNRILSNFGKKIIKQKLERVNEKYGIEVEYINPLFNKFEVEVFKTFEKEELFNLFKEKRDIFINFLT